MREDLYERKPRRRRRRRRVNWTGVFFWLVVLMALIAVIVMLVKPKQSVEEPLPSEESNNHAQWQPQQNQPAVKPVFCGECGAKNEPGTKFCAECGTKLG